MCWTGVTTPNNLRQKRPYVAVGAFVIGMLLTPPDIISQTMLAIPILILYEIGIMVSSLYTRDNDNEEATE
jgi:sec-independent protein translocase protein TatC